MSTRGGVVAVTCLALEAKIARGPGVSVLCKQALELTTALQSAIGQGATGIISFGIAGALAPDLVAGDWVVASGIRHDNNLIATDRAWAQKLLEMLPGARYADVAGMHEMVSSPLEKARLYDQTGAAAVDMESHIAGQIAAERRIPFAACRVIIDASRSTLPPATAVGLHADGTPDVIAVLRSVLQRPGQLPDLIRTAFDFGVARRAMRIGRKRIGIGLGFPEYKNFADFPAGAPAARAGRFADTASTIS
jgi:adenosylhomocysteine nucleosidase